MPIISVDCGKLATEQKKEIIKVFTESMAQITKIPPQYFCVVIWKTDNENLGFAGKTVADISLINSLDCQKNLWEEILSKLKPQLPASAFETWFKPCSFVSFADNILTIAVPNDFAKD